mmetsp:Transcript_9573/g.15676  ORF Transcript_9573/g.15676 Transcript_9573/m.15676 type:complete len:81 (+) Transcript_9573:220-462(+)
MSFETESKHGDESYRELFVRVQDERYNSMKNPTHSVSAQSQKSIEEVYDKLGCSSDTHTDRTTFDKCLNAKLFMRTLSQK